MNILKIGICKTFLGKGRPKNTFSKKIVKNFIYI